MEAIKLQSSFFSSCIGAKTFLDLQPHHRAANRNVCSTPVAAVVRKTPKADSNCGPALSGPKGTSAPRGRRAIHRRSTPAGPSVTSNTGKTVSKAEENGAPQSGSERPLAPTTTLFSFDEPDEDDDHDSSDSDTKAKKDRKEKKEKKAEVETVVGMPKEEIVAIKEKVSALESEVEAERQRAKVLKDQVRA